jgi:hypothetical protein
VTSKKKTAMQTNGLCVSCGRRAGRGDIRCPYCEEQVWRSPAWRAARWSALFLPPVFLVCLATLAARDWPVAAVRRLADRPFSAFLFATATGLLLLPVPDDGWMAGSAADLRRHQIQAHLGGWAMGVYAALGTALFAASATHRVGSAALLFGLGLSIAAMPLFLRIPWRGLFAAALFAAALAGIP